MCALQFFSMLSLFLDRAIQEPRSRGRSSLLAMLASLSASDRPSSFPNHGDESNFWVKRAWMFDLNMLIVRLMTSQEVVTFTEHIAAYLYDVNGILFLYLSRFLHESLGAGVAYAFFS